MKRARTGARQDTAISGCADAPGDAVSSCANPQARLTFECLPEAVPGFVYGLSYPSIRMTLAGGLVQARSACCRLEAELGLLLPTFSGHPLAEETLPGIAGWLLDTLYRVQTLLDIPIEHSGVLASQPGEHGERVTLWAPTFAPFGDHLAKLAQALVQELNEGGALSDERRVEFRRLIAGLRTTAPSSSNMVHFMKAASTLDIPWLPLPDNMVQLGHAARAMRLDSSFTNRTSRIGSVLARNKLSAAQVLRAHGLPTGTHARIASLADAATFAERVGFPVVIKPADADGGNGVVAGIRNEAELAAAIEVAGRHSGNLMIEKHIPGRDYRLVVLDGQLIWAIERIPGGIVGDGLHTVSQLVDFVNAEPGRGEGSQPLKPILLDNEARQLLAMAGLSEESTPPAGRFVRLRSAANIASGGRPQAVFGQVHADNRRLAERAATAIGVDLAGIDLIVPDIARSWLETGGTILEVNAQPVLGSQTSAHLYPEILRRRLPRGGRIPIILVTGPDAQDELADAIAASARARGLVCGIADARGIAIDGTRIGRAGHPFADAQVLLREDSVEFVVVCARDTGFLQTGLPFDAFDVLVVGEAPSGDCGDWAALVRAVLPACRNRVVVRKGKQGRALREVVDAELAGGKSAARLFDRPLGEARFSLALMEWILGTAEPAKDRK